MSYLPDMLALESGNVAVGWLHPDHSFSQADPAPEFLLKLKEYASRAYASAKALGFGAAGGFHSCEFFNPAHGTTNFCVPAGDRMFFSPGKIAPYVEAHRYAAPPEFILAIMARPLPADPAKVEP